MRVDTLVVFLIVAAVLSTVQSLGKSFKDYKLIRITPRTYEQVTYLRELWLAGSPYELDFWQPPSHVEALVDIAVSPSNAEAFIGDVRAKDLSYIVAIQDLDQAIRNETVGSDTPEGAQLDPNVYRLDRYNRLAQMESYLKKLESDNPDRVQLITIGQTHEKRPLTVVKLSGRHSFGEKPAIWIDGGIHAREWIAPATVMYFIQQLEKLYATDPVIQSMLDQLDWYILPVMNPDGYEYSHTSNRRPAQCKQSFFRTVCCEGVDLNRNFDWFWASTGSSSDPCHETYHGPSAFSEPESAAVRDFVTSLGERVKGFVTLHSYSQMWIIPYGHRRRAYPQDYRSALRPLAIRAINALKVLHGTQYTVGTGADIMYEAAGGSADWAKGRARIPYSYLLELRPRNINFANGFLLPENQILPTAEETWEAIKVVADELVGQFGQPIIERKVGGGIHTLVPNQYRLRPTLNPDENSTSSSSSSTTTTPTTSPPTSVEETTATELPTTFKPTTSESTTFESTTFESTTTGSTTIEQTTTASITIEPATNEPNISEHCVDYSKFCHWWRTFGLCDRERVSLLCPKSCDLNCQQR